MKITSATPTFATSLAVSLVDARSMFVALLPNGANASGVDALGHKNTAGGGALNKIQDGVLGAKTTLTKDLCSVDTDSDIQTSIRELGDHGCAWDDATNSRIRCSGPFYIVY